MSTSVFISLGGNLGNTLEIFEKCYPKIEKKIGFISNASKIYQTISWGPIDQPNFLNQVIQVESKLEAATILIILLDIEKSLGRIRVQKWGPRIIDLDILFYGNEIVNELNLVIPHPQIAYRKFVLIPLNELVPDFIHPILEIKIAELLVASTDISEVF